jgi:putative ABC transport system substrate-binding protein
MKRRSFLICLVGAATAGPSIALAQQRQRIQRVGFISGASFAAASAHLAGFPHGMREHGYTEGKDFTIEWRFADGQYDRFPRIAAELAELKVDVIVLGTSAAIRAVEQETANIPIVMGYLVDPVGNGFITSLARPGGRITGLTSSLEDVVSKQVQFLAMSVPEMTRIGLLANPTNPVSPPALNSAAAAVRHIGLELVSVSASDVRAVDAAFSALRPRGSGWGYRFTRCVFQ